MIPVLLLMNLRIHLLHSRTRHLDLVLPACIDEESYRFLASKLLALHLPLTLLHTDPISAIE